MDLPERQWTTPARIHVGIGGWTYGPWRKNFYPEGLAQSRELAYASRLLSSIEINSTFYGAQKPETFAKWRDQTPDGFVFSVKAPRLATHRRVLAEAGESVERFLKGGVSELAAKLGPIVWQFLPGKAFDPADFEAFLALLPGEVDGVSLRHVVDVRHGSFLCPDFLALVRRYRVATGFTDSAEHPSFADLGADVVYVRLMRSDAAEASGYTPAAIASWAAAARCWADGGEPEGLPRVEETVQGTRDSGHSRKVAGREVFVYFIASAKERNPAAAQALLKHMR